MGLHLGGEPGLQTAETTTAAGPVLGVLCESGNNDGPHPAVVARWAEDLFHPLNHDKVEATSLTILRERSLRPQRMHRVHDRRFPRRHIGRNARNDKN